MYLTNSLLVYIRYSELAKMTSHQVKSINKYMSKSLSSGGIKFLWRLLVKGDKVYRYNRRSTSVNGLLIHKWRPKEWNILPRFASYNEYADWFSRINEYECFLFYLSQVHNLISFSRPTNSITTLTGNSLGLINAICSKFNIVGLPISLKLGNWDEMMSTLYILPTVFCLCHQDSKILCLFSSINPFSARLVIFHTNCTIFFLGTFEP